MDDQTKIALTERLQKGRAAKGAGAGGGGMVTHTIRGQNGNAIALRYGRKLAIRLMCVECLGWEGDPGECTAKLCPLWPFRGRTMASRGK